MALTFFKANGGSYIQGQTAQTVEVINYANTMMQNIVQNLTVTTNYQALNGVAVNQRVLQYNPAGVTPETGITTIVANLLGIITEVITAGNLTGLDPKVKPNTTLFCLLYTSPSPRDR